MTIIWGSVTSVVPVAVTVPVKGVEHGLLLSMLPMGRWLIIRLVMLLIIRRLLITPL